MGIKGLLPLLKSIHRSTHVRDFQGCTLGVDAYVLLHRGVHACAWDLALGITNLKYVEYAMRRLDMLIHYGVRPYVVFDGDNLPCKQVTEESRKAKRAENLLKGHRYLKDGRKQDALECFRRAIDVTPSMAHYLIDRLRQADIPFLVAPYEADAQLAYLEQEGYISGIITEDSDLLVFDCKRLLTKMDDLGNCIEINRATFPNVREVNLSHWQDTQFRWMAILSGCDYLPNLPGIGLKKAYYLIRRCQRLERIFRFLHLDKSCQVPPNYEKDFRHAEITFLHQRVFCPARGMLTMRTEPREPLTDEEQHLIGPMLKLSLACGIACGNIDPISKLLFVGDDQCHSIMRGNNNNTSVYGNAMAYPLTIPKDSVENAALPRQPLQLSKRKSSTLKENISPSPKRLFLSAEPQCHEGMRMTKATSSIFLNHYGDGKKIRQNFVECERTHNARPRRFPLQSSSDQNKNSVLHIGGSLRTMFSHNSMNSYISHSR